MHFDIPFYSMAKDDEKAFIIRPVLRDISAVSLDETPHRHRYHEILWIRSGAGKHTIDDELILIEPNTFYWIKQGQIHNFHEGIELEGYLIRFTNTFLPYDPHTSLSTSLISQFKNSPSLQLSGDDIDSAERILACIYEEYLRPPGNTGRLGVLQHLLMALLIMLERKSRSQSISALDRSDSPDKDVYRKFLFLLEDHFRNQHKIGYYSSELGVSNRKLSTIAKQYAGLTAKQLIMQCLMREAKRYLAFTQSTLAEIAYHLGFEDTAYFCRIFKRHTGKTPQQYKKELKLE